MSEIRVIIRIASVLTGLSLSVSSLVATASASDQDPSGRASRDVTVADGPSGEATQALADRLGKSHTGGIFLDQAKDRFVVNVTDEQTARSVQSAGALARDVSYDTAHLESIRQALSDNFRTPGTSWGIDIPANQVAVTADSTVSDTEYEALSRFIEPYGDAAQITRSEGATAVAAGSANGGDYINNGAISCSFGFSVRKKDDPSVRGFLTAGHCTSDSNNRWVNSTGNLLGHTTGHNYSNGNDFGLVNSENPDITYVGNVDLRTDSGTDIQDIANSRDSRVGETVCAAGYRSGYSCGTVTKKGVQVNYSNGHVVTGMDETALCRNFGDSGGPMFSGVSALGVLSGLVDSPNECTSWFQPANEALAWYGVEVF